MVSLSIVNPQMMTAAVRDMGIGLETRGRGRGSPVGDAGEAASDTVRSTKPYVIVDKSLTRC